MMNVIISNPCTRGGGGGGIYGFTSQMCEKRRGGGYIRLYKSNVRKKNNRRRCDSMECPFPISFTSIIL